MNSWEDVPWRGGRAGGYSRRPLEGEPAKGSSSKSVRGPPPLGGFGGDSGTSSKSHIWIHFLTSRVLPFLYFSRGRRVPFETGRHRKVDFLGASFYIE